MARILVAGSIISDRIVRIPGLSPGARIRGLDLGVFTGGAAANTGFCLAAAGHEVVLASALGKGPRGDNMLAELAAAGIEVSRVTRTDVPVAEPIIMVDETGERTILFFTPPDAGGWVDRIDYAAFTEDFDAIYVAMPGEKIRSFCAAASPNTLIVAQWYMNMPAPLSEVLVGSLEAFGGIVPPMPAPEQNGFPHWLVVTDGERGSMAFGRDGSRIDCPCSPAREVRDTTGAGDVYAAGLVHGLLDGLDLGTAMRLGSELSAHQVAVDGPTPSPILAKVFLRYASDRSKAS